MKTCVWGCLILFAAIGFRGLGKALVIVKEQQVSLRQVKNIPKPVSAIPMPRLESKVADVNAECKGSSCNDAVCNASDCKEDAGDDSFFESQVCKGLICKKVMTKSPPIRLPERPRQIEKPTKATDVKVVASSESVIGAAFKASLLRADAADIAQNLVIKQNSWKPKEFPQFRLVHISELPNGKAVDQDRLVALGTGAASPTTFDTSNTCLYVGPTCNGLETCIGWATCSGETTCLSSTPTCVGYTCDGYTCNNTCESTCLGNSTCLMSNTCQNQLTCDYSATLCGGTCFGETCDTGPTCSGVVTCEFSFTCISTCQGLTCSYGTTCSGQFTCESTCFYTGPTCDGSNTCDSGITCDGTYTCNAYTCGNTCYGPTCYGGTTCEGLTCDTTCVGQATCDLGNTCWGITCEQTLCGGYTCDGSITCDPSICAIVSAEASAATNQSRATQYLYALIKSFSNLI